MDLAHDRRPLVAICTATYRRPEGLRRLLDGLAKLDVTDETAAVEVIVVDNDPAAHAAAVVDAHRSTASWPVHCHVEPRTGISFARNRAVAEALALGADFVVFIDDDEVPAPDWLSELLRVQETNTADVVVGPVDPEFETAPPSWIVRGRFFEPHSYRTGQRMKWAVTNNVLVARRVFARVGPLPFSEAFATSGGEDTHFFARVRDAGGVIVWAEGARVSERIPGTRLTPSWLVRRQYRRGQTLSLVLRELVPSRLRRVKRVGHAGVRLAEGALILLTAVIRGRVAVVKGLQRLAFGAGLLTGLAGFRYEEYRTTHGT